MKVTFTALFLLGSLMANMPALAVPSAPLAAAPAVRSLPPGDFARLSSAAAGDEVRIEAILQEAEHAAWLRAVGMHEGAQVTVLRRAPFGGPLHLRSTDGGEFAIHRDLARCIQVEIVQRARRGRSGA